MATMRGSQRTALIAVGLVVAVALAVTAFVLLRPGGGTGGDSATAAIADPAVTAPAPVLSPLTGSGPAPTESGVAAALASQLANPALAQFSGVIMDPASGTTLWSSNPSALQIPASTTKVLTGAALLTSADPTERLVTRVVKGDQDGDIVLVGGGDVTLSARDPKVSTVYEGAPLMSDLAAQIKASGVDVKRIVLDTSYWTGPDFAQGWLTADIQGTSGSPQGYITKMTPLMVDGDRVDPSNENSPRTGDPTNTAGKALARLLGNESLPLVNGTAPQGGDVIAQVSSQPLSVLLAQALVNSDNVLAEALARQVAIARGAPPSFDGATAAIGEALQGLGIDPIGVQIYDGSGLSNDDRVAPIVMATIMDRAVKGDPATLRNLLTGLPVAGVSGSLQDRYADGGSRSGAGWVRAKTGSLQVTYALTGYVPDQDGRILVFAFVSNGVTSGTRPALDAVAAGLRGCGCT